MCYPSFRVAPRKSKYRFDRNKEEGKDEEHVCKIAHCRPTDINDSEAFVEITIDGRTDRNIKE